MDEPVTSVKDGQKFYDRPVHATRKRMEVIVAGALGREVPRTQLLGYERIHLRWMKPGLDGKLVPK